MKKLWILIGIGGLVLLLGGTCVGQYNKLAKTEENIDGAWAQVENVLQRRADLIPNLVATVKGYAAHEREVFTEIAEARSKLLASRGPAEAEAANQQLESALGRLLVIVEAYPELKANEGFIKLQDELAGTENRIAVERMRYNEAVRDYNARIRTFPTNLVAGATGHEKRTYFEAQAGARETPQIDFTR